MSGNAEPKAPDTYGILSLVLGALALVLFRQGGLLFAAGSVIFGVISLVRIQRDRRLTGRALALVGIVLSAPALCASGAMALAAINDEIVSRTPPLVLTAPPDHWRPSPEEEAKYRQAHPELKPGMGALVSPPNSVLSPYLPCGDRRVSMETVGGRTVATCVNGHHYTAADDRWYPTDPSRN